MDSWFSVMPMSQRMELEAGKVYQGYIAVTNPADAKKDFEYVVSVSPYSVIDEAYNVDLSTRSTRTQIVDWMKIDESTGKVKPNETKKIYFTVTVPMDAPAGGQYASIGVRSAGEESMSGGVMVQNVFEMASVVYATVKGETLHEGEITSNNIPGFIFSPPATVNGMVANTGNVHEVAEVSIVVKDKFSGEVLYPAPDEPQMYEELVMPASNKYLVKDLNVLGDLGVYEVTQDISYLGKTSNNTRTLIVCPLWFLLLVALTVGALIATIGLVILKRKKERRIL